MNRTQMRYLYKTYLNISIRAYSLCFDISFTIISHKYVQIKVISLKEIQYYLCKMATLKKTENNYYFEFQKHILVEKYEKDLTADITWQALRSPDDSPSLNF